VPRGVDDVDAVVAAQRQLIAVFLDEDGDAALRSWSLESMTRSAPAPKRSRRGAGLLQQLVDQRGLAMVDVGDDGDIA
jgi:hypothetical protein